MGPNQLIHCLEIRESQNIIESDAEQTEHEKQIQSNLHAISKLLENNNNKNVAP